MCIIVWIVLNQLEKFYLFLIIEVATQLNKPLGTLEMGACTKDSDTIKKEI